MCRIFIHTSHLLLYIWTQDIFSAVINTVRANKNLLKLLIRIQQYTATDFQGLSKITLKIKMAHFSTLEVGLEKLTLTAI